jgi:2-iminobutanoate/2-iminopropanoate deaminase
MAEVTDSGMANGAIQPAGVAKPAAPFSPVVVSGEMVYTAGQVGFDAAGSIVEGGVAAQTRQAFENLRLCLEAAGCALEDVVKVNAYLADLDDFASYNDAYRELFREPYPARTTVGAALAPGLLVEVEAVARRPA